MTTKHFTDRFSERVGGLKISNEEMMDLYTKSEQLSRQSTKPSECICIHIFDDKLVSHDKENELWILIRNRKLVSTWRRNSENRKFTNEDGMKVDKVSYKLN